jgi:hypothetical protein
MFIIEWALPLSQAIWQGFASNAQQWVYLKKETKTVKIWPHSFRLAL